jgi:hypothetical protein
MIRKAAIVIGVDNTGGLTPLASAARCAREIASWLEGEGYDVACLTDDDPDSPVTTDLITKAIDRFVTTPPRYHQLVVYFSGHGYWHARTDIWLLSKAPVRTEEGINLDGAIDLARYSGIPNVVFISDACRSIPDARTGALMKGIDAFPNLADVETASKIDVFKATSDAQQAYEGMIDGKPSSVLSHALLSAFVEPTPVMVREIVENGTTVRVVPNRRLESFLQEKVGAALASINPGLMQKIEANVPSSDDVYLARVRTPGPGGPSAPMEPPGTAGPPPPAPTPSPSPPPSVERVAARGVRRALSERGSERNGTSLALDLQGPEAQLEISSRLPVVAVDHFESQCGFTVQGASLAAARCTSRGGPASVEILSHGDGAHDPGILRVWSQGPGESVLVRFADGRGVVLAALSGYIGHVACSERGVTNVSYVPSANHWRWHAYAQKREHVDHLRALVAVAADQNVFRVQSEDEATRLGDEIRMEKALDPTLGLYAAHAYSQAGELGRVRSVARYMLDDLAIQLFDLQVLEARSSDDPDGAVLPFTPMLTQTWNLLRPRGFELAPIVSEAAAYLCSSLWTTFEPGGADLLDAAMEREEIA